MGDGIMTGPKTFHVKSFGCQMNVYDGERMAEAMAAAGYTAAPGEDADLVVLNTCHIREKATEKVYSDIGRMKKHRPDQMIAVAGCVAQAEGAEIVRRAKVDVVGTTKGKGFAGVMKRHGFAGVSASHGAHRNHRKPGSIGGASTPGRVFRGQRMAGRMGNERQTTQNLTVFAVDAEKGLLLVKGAVPGPKGGVVLVRSAVKGA